MQFSTNINSGYTKFSAHCTHVPVMLILNIVIKLYNFRPHPDELDIVF